MGTRSRVLTPSLAQSQAALCASLGHSLDSVSEATLHELSVEAAKANPAWWSRGDPWFPGPDGGCCPSSPCPGQCSSPWRARAEPEALLPSPAVFAEGGPSFQVQALVGISAAALGVAVLPVIFTKTH